MLDNNRAEPEVFDQFVAVVDQVHERAATGRESWLKANLRDPHPGCARHQQSTILEAHALLRRVLAHDRSRATQVRSSRLEYSLRIQSIRLCCDRAVHSEPSRRARPETWHLLADCEIHDRRGAIWWKVSKLLNVFIN